MDVLETPECYEDLEENRPSEIPGDFNNGMRCSLGGKPTYDMNETELIGFIGELDRVATSLYKSLQAIQMAVNEQVDFRIVREDEEDDHAG